MDSELILQPVLTGLSTGIFCFSYCFPFMGAFFGAKERSARKNLLILLEFLGGRLAGYLCFGLLAGYLGEKFDLGWLRRATDISFIALSLMLLAYLLGAAREKTLCWTPGFLKDRGPAVMGFFMGINLCPPFLLSLTYVFSRQNALYGMLYFALFFLTSSLYFLPMVFVGLAARAREFRTLARISGLMVGILFLVYGTYSLLHN